MTAEIEIERGGESILVEVLGCRPSGLCSRRDRYGLLLEPEEAPEIELLEVGADLYGVPYVLDAAEEERALEALAKAAEENPRQCI